MKTYVKAKVLVKDNLQDSYAYGCPQFNTGAGYCKL